VSRESVCQVARSWVDVGSFYTRLVVRFMIFTASFRNILDTPSYDVAGVCLNARRSKGRAVVKICRRTFKVEVYDYPN
jgi:hypothetical protein